MKKILAIDQGTSSTKAIIFDETGKVCEKSMAALSTDYQANGFVEQNPKEIYLSVLEACKQLNLNGISAIGISNQRETFVLWDKKGESVLPAIVWACKRSVEICKKRENENSLIKEKTGLIIDPYFSGTKLLWVLENHPEIKRKIEKGEIYFGTIDTWLLFKLTEGKEFKTDYTNASRTLLFNIHELNWDQEILKNWGLENLNLPEIIPSSANFGLTNLGGLLENSVEIHSMIGDSHASLFGESCFEKGGTKMTMGTGCSLLMNIGNQPIQSKNQLLTTIGFSTQNEVVYAWEGAIVSCGSMITWLKDSLILFDNPIETAKMAESIPDNGGVYLVPGFAGLGAPIWKMDRKASFIGINFGTSSKHLVRATLEAIIFQIRDVLDAMEKDLGEKIPKVAMHGGLSKNLFIQKHLSALINSGIEIQESQDISAFGAGLLAGLSNGIYSNLNQIQILIQKKELKKDISLSNEIEKSYNHWKEIIEKNLY